MRSGVLTYRSDLSVCMRKRNRRHKLLPQRSPYVTFVCCCWCCNSRCHGRPTALHLKREFSFPTFLHESHVNGNRHGVFRELYWEYCNTTSTPCCVVAWPPSVKLQWMALFRPSYCVFKDMLHFCMACVIIVWITNFYEMRKFDSKCYGKWKEDEQRWERESKWELLHGNEIRWEWELLHGNGKRC